MTAFGSRCRRTDSGTRLTGWLADGYQLAVGAEVAAALDEGGRGARGGVEPVDADQLELRSRFQDKCFAVVVGEKYFSVGADGRRGKSFAARGAESSLPH